MARLTADKLGDKLGQRVIVENRPGAGGNIGYESVAKSPADGWGVAAPGGLPAEMTQKLNAAIRDALADADLRDKLAKLEQIALTATAGLVPIPVLFHRPGKNSEGALWLNRNSAA
jgi:tripartite-type tricarboxylate transporter receptor subunit TctC